jgi:hypothetical protein
MTSHGIYSIVVGENSNEVFVLYCYVLYVPCTVQYYKNVQSRHHLDRLCSVLYCVLYYVLYDRHHGITGHVQYCSRRKLE